MSTLTVTMLYLLGLQLVCRYVSTQLSTLAMHAALKTVHIHVATVGLCSDDRMNEKTCFVDYCTNKEMSDEGQEEENNHYLKGY